MKVVFIDRCDTSKHQHVTYQPNITQVRTSYVNPYLNLLQKQGVECVNPNLLVMGNILASGENSDDLTCT